jgi:hypothetical protein
LNFLLPTNSSGGKKTWASLGTRSGIQEAISSTSHNISLRTLTFGARGRVLGWGNVLQAGRSRVRYQPHYDPGVDSASNRNEYQESSWDKRPPARGADNLTAIYVQKIWEPRRLKTLRAFMACYTDSFTFFYINF